MTTEQLLIKANEMMDQLKSVTGSEPQDIMVRLELLNNMLADSSHCLALSKYHQDTVVNESIMAVLGDESFSGASATIINNYVKSKAKDINFLVNIFDRINSTAVHQIDSLRSILSYQKQTMIL